jgi:hypothetical protein
MGFYKAESIHFDVRVKYLVALEGRDGRRAAVAGKKSMPTEGMRKLRIFGEVVIRVECSKPAGKSFDSLDESLDTEL